MPDGETLSASCARAEVRPCYGAICRVKVSIDCMSFFRNRIARSGGAGAQATTPDGHGRCIRCKRISQVCKKTPGTACIALARLASRRKAHSSSPLAAAVVAGWHARMIRCVPVAIHR